MADLRTLLPKNHFHQQRIFLYISTFADCNAFDFDNLTNFKYDSPNKRFMPQKTKKKAKEIYVKICPRCKTAMVSQDKSILQKTGALPPLYLCKNCGHSGYVFPEIKASKLKDFEVEVEQKGLRITTKDKTELVDTAYGKFEVHFLWKITGPITLLVGILILFQPRAYEEIISPSFFNIYGGIILLIGLFMVYITYFNKRKLMDD